MGGWNWYTFNMKKIILAFANIPTNLKKEFENFVGKVCGDIRFALIEDAANPSKEKSWVIETRKGLRSLGINFTVFELLPYINKQEELLQELRKYDVIWFGGGNTFYLRWLMKETGFDKIISQLLESGIVYGGGSAGAIVAGPILKKFDIVDNTGSAPEIIYEGLNITSIVTLPHWGVNKFQSSLDEIKSYYENSNYKFVTISDENFILVENNNFKVL